MIDQQSSSNSAANVLVISADAERLTGLLARAGFRIAASTDLVGALVALRSISYRAIVCDADAETVRVLVSRCPGVPVVAAGSGDESEAVAMLSSGAGEYVNGDAATVSEWSATLARAVARAQGQQVSPEWRDSYLRRFSLLKDLFAITTDPHRDVAAQATSALHIGCELFGLELGIVSRVVGDDYYVEYVHAPGKDLAAGQHFKVSETICDITLSSDVPLGIDDLARSAWGDHPCRNLGLAAYLGAPLYVEGRLFGTLAFAATLPRALPWSEMDLELVGTFAAWIGSLLAHLERVAMAVADAPSRQGDA